MTIAHLSDTHLGFRAYGRTTPAGLNQREADVMATFEACLDAILARDPDVVVHAGDLFHVVRPSNATIVRTFQAFTRFQSLRGGKPLILIGGNHDTPRSSDSGNILRLFEGIPGLRLVPHRVETLDFPDLDLEVMAVPSPALSRDERPEYVPTLGRRHAILTLHGMARQALPAHGEFDVSQTRHDAWTYVALGDYHTFQAYGANVAYAGSTDFASTNIWEEATLHEKGWLWFDTEVGRLEHVPLATRAVIDLPILDAQGLGKEEVEARLRENAVWDAEMPIVRQRVANLAPSLRGKLDPSVAKEIAQRALNYQLQLLRTTAVLPERETTRVVTLEDQWRAHADTVALPRDVDRGALRERGLSLLKEVASHEATSTQA